MKATEGKLGRVFVMRLEEGDQVPEVIDRFALQKGISVAHVILIGGLGSGSVVVGPRDSAAIPPDPMLLPVDGAHEVVGVGVIAPDDRGQPTLHMHAALGRSGQTITGCLRPGVKVWLVGEAIIYEILGVRAARKPDTRTRFHLLECE
jgi:uncharacterized protein